MTTIQEKPAAQKTLSSSYTSNSSHWDIHKSVILANKEINGTNDEKHVSYLKDIFIKACIQALQSDAFGLWIHLLEVLNLIKPVCKTLLSSNQVLHYIHRIYQYSDKHEQAQKLNIIPFLKEVFSDINFNVSPEKSIEKINSRTYDTHGMNYTVLPVISSSTVHVYKDAYFPTSDPNNLFEIHSDDLMERLYQPRSLHLTDLQRFLPQVVSDIAKLECTWNSAFGLTLTSLNTNMPQTILPDLYSSNGDTSLLPVVHEEKNAKKTITKPKTGREVVESLMKSTNGNVIQIWYLNFAPSKVYEPYNLVVCSKNNVKNEHVVISVFGVLHVKVNGDSELMPLGQWYMEAVWFNNIRHIKFFKNYLLTKTFKRWKRNIKYKQFCKIRKQISHSTLMNIPSTPGSILKIKKLLLQSESLQFFPNFEEVGVAISKFETEVKEQFDKCCKYLIRMFQIVTDMVKHFYTDCTNYNSYCQAQLDIINNNTKESMAIIKKRKEHQMKNKRTAQYNLDRFDKFQKLIYNMISARLVCIISTQLEKFVMRQLLNNETGCFYTAVVVSDHRHVSLQPMLKELCETVVDIFESIIMYLQQNMSTEPHLLHYTCTSRDEQKNNDKLMLHEVQKHLEVENCGKQDESIEDQNFQKIYSTPIQNIKQTIWGQDIVKYSIARITRELVVASTHAEAFVESISWLEDIILFVDEWGDKDLETWKTMPAFTVEKHMLTIKSWCEQIENMTQSYTSPNKLIFIHCLPIQEMLLPRLRSIFEHIMTVLTKSNLLEAKKMKSELEMKIEELSNGSLKVDEFAAFFVNLNVVQDQLPLLQQKVDYMKSIFNVIKHCYRHLSSTEEKTEEKLSLTWEKFMFKLQTGQDFISEHASALIKTLKDDLAKMICKALETVIKATSGDFIDKTQDCSRMLKYLKKLYIEYEAFEKKISLYSHCQLMITGEEMDFTKLNEAKRKISARLELWKYLELTKQTINEWKNMSFKRFLMNIKKVSEKVQRWKNALETLKNDIPENDQVFSLWIELIEEFYKNFMVLQELASPALRSRHWKDIFVLLGSVYDDSVLYHVSDIIDMRISSHYDELHQICFAAASECALENFLDSMIKDWEKRDFKFAKNLQRSSDSNWKKAHHKEMSVIDYTLTGIDELSYLVEDSLVTLQSMLVSPRVAGVRELASHWDSLLQELKEIINLWITAQQQWYYLGNMFASVQLQKQHAAEYDIFIGTNQKLKELTDNIMKDSKVLNVLEQKTTNKNSSELQGEKLKKQLHQIIQKQSVVIKKLEEYLAHIQDFSPRLYFLSNDEMLNLLAINRNSKELIPFVRKCFPGVQSVNFEIPQTSTTKLFTSFDASLNAHMFEAVALVGELDEKFDMEKKLPFNIPVEKWFKHIENMMKEAVWKNIYECVQEILRIYSGKKYTINMELFRDANFRNKFTFQSLVLFHDALWSDLIQDFLHANITRVHALTHMSQVLANLTRYLRNCHITNNSENSDRKILLLIQVLALQLIHYQEQLKDDQLNGKSTYESLKLLSVSMKISEDDFKQTQKDFKVELHCFGYNLSYGYEYISPSSSLIFTPLTDRCMLSLITALKDFRVGCITGKSHHGKSEMAYHLAKKLGRHFISLTCSLDTPLSCISQIMYGALGVGSILCLDNSQLLSEKTLSVLGQYFYNIHHALTCLCIQKKFARESERCRSAAEINRVPDHPSNSTVHVNNAINLHVNEQKVTAKNVQCMAPKLGCIFFENRLVKVSSLYASIMVIKGNYNDWKTIPNSMKEMLRLVSFHSISAERMYEAWLVMNGFTCSNNLSKKINVFVECLSNVSEQLLPMKRVKSIINETAKTLTEHGFKREDEETFLAKNIFHSLKPSLENDIQESIIEKIEVIFPSCRGDLTTLLSKNLLLLESVKEQMHADNLSPKSDFFQKVLTLYRVLSENKSAILVGSAATGKTTCYKTLSRALCEFYSPWSQRKDLLSSKMRGKFARIDLKVIYPNVFNADQIYGHFDPSIDSWVDGLFTKMLCSNSVLEDAAMKAQNVCDIQQWFIMDGNISDSWIVPFESLLDYSNQFVIGNVRKLTLAENAKVVFETDTLESVSPALISRSTMIHFHDDEIVDWKCVFNSWKISAYNKFSLDADELAAISDILSYTLMPVVKFIKNNCVDIFTVDIRHRSLKSKSSVMECMHTLHILSAVLEVWKSRDHHAVVKVDKEIEKKFVCHSVAYSLVNALSPLVHDRYLEKLDVFIRQIFSTCPVYPAIFPCHMLDCYFDGELGELLPWNEQINSSKISIPSNFVLTQEHQKLFHLSSMLIASGRNVLLVGAPGSGKSAFVKNVISTLCTPIKIQLSKAMSAEHFQNKLQSKSKIFFQQQENKPRLKTVKNPSSENFVFFIDDLNLSVQHHLSNATPISECIRQISMEGGVYDYNGKYFHHLPHTQFIVSYSPPGDNLIGSHLALQQRCYRHFNILKIPSCTHQQMMKLFTLHCQKWLNGFHWLPCKEILAHVLSTATINLHQSISEKFVFTPATPQYIFSQHDIAKVFKGLFLFSSHLNMDIKDDPNLLLLNNSQGYAKQSISEIFQSDQTKQDTQDALSAELTRLIHLWCHEIQNVYGGRCSCSEDTDWLKKRIMKQVDTTFEFVNATMVSMTEYKVLPYTRLTENELFSALVKKALHEIHMLFDLYYINIPSENEPITLSTIKKAEFKEMLHKAMQSDEISSNNRELVLFDDMLNHAEKLCQVLNVPGGHALLLSQNGHGRNKIFRMVARLLKQEKVEVHFSSSKYDQIAAVKDACNIAGLKGKSVLLYVSQFIADETMLSLSALVNDGYCPGLYTTTELSMICSDMLPGGHKRKKEEYGRIEDRFFQRIKQNLHIIICLNIDDVKSILNKFPMFLHKMLCVDMYQEWSKEVLEYISFEWLQAHSTEALDVDTNCFTEISCIMAELHLLARKYTKKMFAEKGIEIYSPSKFIEFIDLFTALYGLIKTDQLNDLKHLESGVAKINEAEQMLTDTCNEIKNLTPIIAKSNKVVTVADKKMKDAEAEYAKVKKITQQQEEKIKELQGPCDDLRNGTKDDFDKLSPLYDAALKALSLLDYHVVEELRSYHAPPEGVKYVTGMLCIMFQVDPQWEEAKLLLMTDKFIQKLQCYDKDNISDAIYNKMSSFVQNPSSQSEELLSISHAANQLSLWIHAIYSYNTILRRLQPKKDALKDATKAVEQAEKELGVLKIRCSEIEEELAMKISDYDEKSKVLKSLQNKNELLCDSKAHTLALLESMKIFTDEWSRKITACQTSLSSAVGDSIMVAASVVYLGILNQNRQEELNRIWMNGLSEHTEIIDRKDALALIEVLSSEEEQDQWLKLNKWNDKFQINNALRMKTISLLSKKCCPLLIDPRDVGECWVKMIEDGLRRQNCGTHADQSNVIDTTIFSHISPMGQTSSVVKTEADLLIFNADDVDFDEKMTSAMSVGCPVLVKHVERVNKSCLLMQLINQRIQYVNDDTIRIGKKIMKCIPGFRLYLSASVPMKFLDKEKFVLPLRGTIPISLETETCSLTEALHQKVIHAEKPEWPMQTHRMKLDVQFLKDEKRLLHTKILQHATSLATPLVKQKNILDFMGFYQEKLLLMNEKHFECKAHYEEMAKQVEEYKPLATYAASTYNTMQGLENIHHLYNFPRHTFMEVFEQTLKQSQITKVVSASVPARVEEIKKIFTKNLFERISSSVFLEHVFMFPFCIVLQEVRNNESISGHEIYLFLSGFDVDFTETSCAFERPDWLERKSWQRLVHLSSVTPCYNNLLNSLTKQGHEWQEYFKLTAWVVTPPSFEYEEIHKFHLALLWLAYDMSLLPVICENMILCHLGPDFLKVSTFDTKKIMSCSRHSAVNIILLPDDEKSIIIQDPCLVLSRYASEQNSIGAAVISMGGVQQLTDATKAIRNARKRGSWVILQNCHLINEWPQMFLTEILKVFSATKDSDENKKRQSSTGFRLWMILQASKEDFSLPDVICQHSNTFVWQYGKNQPRVVKDMLISSSSHLLERNREMLVGVFQNEASKNVLQVYNETTKISSCELDFSARLCDHILENSITPSTAIIQDIVYKPRLSTSYDTSLLTKNIEDKHLKANLDHRSKITCDTLRNCHNICRQSNRLFNFNEIKTLYMRLESMQVDSVIPRIKLFRKSFIVEHILEEMKTLRESLTTVLDDLNLNMKVLQNRAPSTEVLTVMHEKISIDSIPDTWKRFLPSARSLNMSLDILGKRLAYFNSFLSNTSEMQLVFDLSYFNNPKHLLLAVKLQYSFDLDVSDHDSEWTGKVCSTVPSNITSLKDGIYVENVTLVHATFSDAKQKGTCTVLLLQYEPRQKSEYDDDDVVLNVYKSIFHRDESLFTVSVKASTFGESSSEVAFLLLNYDDHINC